MWLLTATYLKGKKMSACIIYIVVKRTSLWKKCAFKRLALSGFVNSRESKYKKNKKAVILARLMGMSHGDHI